MYIELDAEILNTTCILKGGMSEGQHIDVATENNNQHIEPKYTKNSVVINEIKDLVFRK